MLREVREAIWREVDGTWSFDFNTLVPMPESLHGETPHHLECFVKGERFGRAPTTDEERALVDTMRANIRDHGHIGWYEWSRDNWGTKWNAYDCSFEGSVLAFDTAWAHPIPVIRALFVKFPDVLFRVQFADEDRGQNLGTYTSERRGIRHPEFGSDEAMGAAFKIKGDDPRGYLQEYHNDESDEWPQSRMDAIISAYEAWQL